ncbi:MAG TPA: type II secretion system F family protein [Candidatus Saccharimonadales bacterium]|nr:type II secretion system F family protein [Candidatus Saccharimonadales bacterium]
MQSYKYTARNAATGEKVKSVVQASDEQAAAKLLQKQGLTPVDISLQNDTSKGMSKIFNRVRAKDRILFARQLSTLINAGLPLVQSLRSVQNTSDSKPLKIIIGQMIADVEGGSTFSASLGKHPDIFNEVFISLIAAGEVSGTLDKALERIADQQEKDAEILSKVRGAMIYPLVVLFVMALVVTFMVVKVLPQVQLLYDGLPGAKLPFVTVALLAVSHFITKFWWVVIIMFIFSGFFGTRWIRTLGGRSIVDKFKMRAWPIGNLFMKVYMARFARTGTTLVASGVPLLQVLEICARSVNNVHISASLKRAADKVKGGKALSESISGDPNFLELVPNMIKIGEQSGALETMMEKVATYYEKEVDNEVKAISTIIEPVLMIVMGVVAMTIVAAILLPVYGLVGKGVIQ